MKRAFFVPEVIQTSMMDCGPASLVALLQGLGVPASYGRLREACQVGLDGTAIATLEALLLDAGFDAAEVLVPVDHALRPEANNLPAIGVVQLPDGAAHFLVLWRRVGDWVQVMDPASGRAWLRVDELQRRLLRVTVEVGAEDWQEWAGTEDFQAPLRAALGGLAPRDLPADWAGLAGIEAAGRAVRRLARTGLLAAREAPAAVRRIAEAFAARPEAFGSLAPVVRPEGEGLAFTGAPLVRVRGRTGEPPGPVFAALTEPAPVRPWRHLLHYLRKDLRVAPLVASTLLVALLGVGEALFVRALVPMLGELPRFGDRVILGACVAGVVLLGLGVERARLTTLLRLGRTLDLRLRVALFEKLPRIPDAWFASRPASDMAERAASLRALQGVPRLFGEMALTVASLVVTTAALCVLDPWTAPVTLLAAGLSILAPAAVQPLLRERELRARAHGGALLRFHLDAQLGLLPVRAQGAEASLVAAHEELIGEWARATRELGAVGVWIEAVVATCGALGAILLVGLAAWRAETPAGLLLQAWWALLLPALGERLVALARQLPTAENVTRRMLEPLATPEEVVEPDSEGVGPVRIVLDHVSVKAGGHTVLDDVSLEIGPGEHVAVVGASGAGKSTLVGLLLGVHSAAEGIVRVDGRPVGPWLRKRIAWIDPGQRLWDRPLADNLACARAAGDPDWGALLDDADLVDVVGRLEDGMQQRLGWDGARLSGGQGQRVRVGRALGRDAPGLVLLDEPFRGLDRAARSTLLWRVRERRADATLLCVTHDVRDTLAFGRVLVVDGGKVVEDGNPIDLSRGATRYAAMLAEAERVDAEVWGQGWRRLHVAEGRVVES